jgi:hypothetical protein
MDEKRRAEIEGYLAEIAQRQLAAEKRMEEWRELSQESERRSDREQAKFNARMDRADARMDRADARMDRAEARMAREEALSKARWERSEARMDKFDKRLEGTRKIIQYGMKLIVRIEQGQAKAEERLDRLERLILGPKGRSNGHR